MSEETQSDKSPRSPNYTLEYALDQVRKLHSQIGKATVKPESAAIALGYKGVNGAALTTFGTLSQYGLIERSKGMVNVTPLAIRLLHPTGDAQLKEARREAALAPKIFKEIHEKLGQCSVEVLTSHLVQNGFTPDRAKRSASVYAANKGFANLTETGTKGGQETATERTARIENGDSKEKSSEQRQITEKTEGIGVIAQYSIPLGGNEATLTFKGDCLSVSDFDALIEYVELFKKQFQRKNPAATASPPEMQTEEGDFH
jgi:hypothetical protein